MRSFSGKTAAITGAGSGIGRALALALAERGCHLALADVNERALQTTVQDAQRLGVKVSSRRVDVSVREEVFAWAAQAALEHGRINLLFNNAGVGQSGTVEGTDLADFEWLIGINVWGVIYGTKAFLPILKKSGDGHIVNISSIAGIFSQPGMSAYNASKFAVRGFTESLRQELDLEDCGVSATCVHPGGIRTGIFKAARLSDSMRNVLGRSAENSRDFIERLVITSPEKAARVILDAVRRDARRVLIGPDAHALVFMQRVLPVSYQRALVELARYTRRRAGSAVDISEAMTPPPRLSPAASATSPPVPAGASARRARQSASGS